jgi:hypothetical protein
MSTDAIVLLKQDHTEVKALSEAFHAADSPTAKGKIVDKIIEELTVHTYIENECMYPEARKLLPDIEGDVLSSFSGPMRCGVRSHPHPASRCPSTRATRLAQRATGPAPAKGEGDQHATEDRRRKTRHRNP